MTDQLIHRGIYEHAKALERREYSAVELLQAYLAQIEKKEPVVGSYLTLNIENAMRDAASSDARRAKGEVRGAFDGIPYALKDNFCTEGLRTTCASRMLENFVPPYDATVVSKLKGAGAILLGKANMDEFAMGSATETSALGITRNPIDPDYVPGGSSGGSAAAVAAHEAVFALGSDTGGSVRQPAAYCGVVGMKPTYGLISRFGMIALASSLDCVGIVTQTANDCGMVLSLLAGRDERDATSHCPVGIDFSSASRKRDRRLRVAIVRELMQEGDVSPAVMAATEDAIMALKECGYEIGEVSLPSPDAALAAYCVISAAEASSNLARYDGVSFGRRSEHADDLFSLYANSRSEGFGTEVKRRILFGTYMLSEGKRALYYDRATEARVFIKRAMEEILEHYDLILTPTAPSAAFRRGNVLSPMQRRRADLCAVYSSLAGLPAVSVPFGTNAEGLPLGIQLTGAPFSEGLLLEVAQYLEEVRP
jgi:aspartyl-tRNA(Asn)/glutamyl-tRNA(Gln) amidotransferase subunit A